MIKEVDTTIWRNEDGQGMVEYGLILGLISIAAVAVIALLGPKINGLFQNANDTIEANIPGT